MILGGFMMIYRMDVIDNVIFESFVVIEWGSVKIEKLKFLLKMLMKWFFV